MEREEWEKGGAGKGRSGKREGEVLVCPFGEAILVVSGVEAEVGCGGMFRWRELR